jgi:hypothetical protein
MLIDRRYTCVLTLAFLAILFEVEAGAQNKSAPGPKIESPAVTSSVRSAAPESAPAPSQASLPVRRVVLYKSGVGYFEHQGRVRGDQSVAIDFTSSQLNDVLQSLTLLDLNGGRITGVNYNSEAPLNQRLAMLSLPLAADTDIEKFYGALRGVRLEMRTGTTDVTGRLLSVERKTRVSGGTTLEVDLATLVSDSGQVRSVEVTPAVAVQVADRDVTKEVTRYLSLLASARQDQLRRMTIATAGTGDRQLYVSYVSEVPIWKTTYRVVLPSKAGDESLLQGWAIVDNTVGEDWNDVELSLVAGAPQSFIQPLSQPYYARRPVVPLPIAAQLAPQTHEGAMGIGGASLSGTVKDSSGAVIPYANVTLLTASGQTAGSVVTDMRGQYRFGDLPAGAYRLQAASNGFDTTAVNGLSLGGGTVSTQDVKLQVGSFSQMVTVSANASVVSTDAVSSEALSRSGRNTGSGNELGDKAYQGAISAKPGFGIAGGVVGAPAALEISQARDQTIAAASGFDLGDLFEYKLKDRVTIRKNESALVPIVQAHVAAEKVSLWNDSLGSARPLRALWLTNSSSLTLDGGSFSVLEDEAFSGQGLLDPIRPGEKRLVSYAVDLAVRVDKSATSSHENVTKVQISKGQMRHTSEQRMTTTYNIRNDDDKPRLVLIEHPVRSGWHLNPNDPKPDETTSSAYRFRVSVGAKGSTALTLREVSPLVTTYSLSSLTSEQVDLFLQQKTINPEVEAALRKIVAQQNVVSDLEEQISAREDETSKIFDDQERLRENLKALKGSPEERALTQRYTQQLASQKTRLDALKKESADLQSKHDQAQKDLDDIIAKLNLDADI